MKIKQLFILSSLFLLTACNSKGGSSKTSVSFAEFKANAQTISTNILFGSAKMTINSSKSSVRYKAEFYYLLDKSSYTYATKGKSGNYEELSNYEDSINYHPYSIESEESYLGNLSSIIASFGGSQLKFKISYYVSSSGYEIDADIDFVIKDDGITIDCNASYLYKWDKQGLIRTFISSASEKYTGFGERESMSYRVSASYSYYE